jgi:hypothetical protein
MESPDRSPDNAPEIIPADPKARAITLAAAIGILAAGG